MIQLIAILVVLSCTVANARESCFYGADTEYLKSLCGSSTSIDTDVATTVNGVPLTLTVDCRNSFAFTGRISKCAFSAGFKKLELERYNDADVSSKAELRRYRSAHMDVPIIYNGIRYLLTCCGDRKPVVLKTEETLAGNFCKAVWQAEDAKALEATYLPPPPDAVLDGFTKTSRLPQSDGSLEVAYDVQCFGYEPQIARCKAYDALTQQYQSVTPSDPTFGGNAVIWRNSQEFFMSCRGDSGAYLGFVTKGGFARELCKDLWNEMTGSSATPRSNPIAKGALFTITTPKLVADDQTTSFTMQARVDCFDQYQPHIKSCSFLAKDNSNLAADATVTTAQEEVILKLKSGPDFKVYCSPDQKPTIKKWDLFGRMREAAENALDKLNQRNDVPLFVIPG